MFEPRLGNSGGTSAADLQRQVRDDFFTLQDRPPVRLLYHCAEIVVEMGDVETEFPRVGDMEWEDVKALSGMIPIGWRELFGSTKDDMEGVWSRELTVECIVGRVPRDWVHQVGSPAERLCIARSVLEKMKNGIISQEKRASQHQKK